MYPNLEAEMVRRRITRDDIAKKLNRNYSTVCQKLSGKVDFTYTEAVTIKKVLFPDCDLEELFEKEEH